MPNIKAAKKWTRQSQTRTTRNKDAKSRLRTLYKSAVSPAQGTTAQIAESAFDKAASKGIIHRNKAARKKAKLAKALRRTATPAAKPVKAAKARKSKA